MRESLQRWKYNNEIIITININDFKDTVKEPDQDKKVSILLYKFKEQSGPSSIKML